MTARAARIATWCSAPICSTNSDSIIAGWPANRPRGYFPGAGGIPPITRSPPRSPGTPVAKPPNEPISSHRLVALADGMVTFRWRDSAHNNKKRLMTLGVEEFLRRFLLHVLPPGFVRIRHFGFLAHRRRRASLPLCLQLLAESGRIPNEAK